MRVRRVGVIVGTGMAVAVAVASAAWACTAWTAMSPLSEPAGKPGTEVTVRGTTPNGPVAIRWDGLQGPVLATVDIQNGSFATKVRIPEAPPGLHYVVVSSQGDGGWSRAAFKIPGRVPTAPAVGSGTSSGRLPAQTRPWADAASSETGGGGAGMGPGLVLLAGGSVALVAGFAVLGVRRSRAGTSVVRED